MTDLAMNKIKKACSKTARLWSSGFIDACCLHRVYFFCRRSQKVFVKTGQCFLLNGGLFLGSIIFLQKVVVPVLEWLLLFQVKGEHTSKTGELFLETLQQILIGICYVFWFYPLYMISFVINCIWYNEIAKQAFEVANTNTNEKQQHVSSQNQGGSAMESILFNIGEQVYSVVMLSIFFVEVFAVSYIPYIGNLLNFLLLSWLYAYYCFDYRWNFAQWSLERRLVFFETNWAFFAGFGSPCVLATFFFSPLVSYGVMAILFPLFVLVATGSRPETAVASNKRANAEREPTRVPVFYLSNMLMLYTLRGFKRFAIYFSSRNRPKK